jgi:hypothetical protein
MNEVLEMVVMLILRGVAWLLSVNEPAADPRRE